MLYELCAATLVYIVGLLSFSYNIIGHIKCCLIMLGGWFILHEPLTLLQALGVALTIAGKPSMHCAVFSLAVDGVDTQLCASSRLLIALSSRAMIEVTIGTDAA